MDLNYAIFRSESIYTLNDLAQIGAHNKREKKAYNSNPDIKKELSYQNMELVPLDVKYDKGFHELTKEHKKQHNEKQKSEKNSLLIYLLELLFVSSVEYKSPYMPSS